MLYQWYLTYTNFVDHAPSQRSSVDVKYKKVEGQLSMRLPVPGELAVACFYHVTYDHSFQVPTMAETMGICCKA